MYRIWNVNSWFLPIRMNRHWTDNGLDTLDEAIKIVKHYELNKAVIYKEVAYAKTQPPDIVLI
jgi:hypothetical protein